MGVGGDGGGGGDGGWGEVMGWGGGRQGVVTPSRPPYEQLLPLLAPYFNPLPGNFLIVVFHFWFSFFSFNL